MERRFALSTSEAKCALDSRDLVSVCASCTSWAPLAQARPPVRNERRRKVGTKVNLSASEGREHGPNGDEGATAGEAPRPQYTVMPSSVRDVSCAPMSAWLLQDAGPWIAFQSMDGSGELCY